MWWRIYFKVSPLPLSLIDNTKVRIINGKNKEINIFNTGVKNT